MITTLAISGVSVRDGIDCDILRLISFCCAMATVNGHLRAMMNNSRSKLHGFEASRRVESAYIHEEETFNMRGSPRRRHFGRCETVSPDTPDITNKYSGSCSKLIS